MDSQVGEEIVDEGEAGGGEAFEEVRGAGILGSRAGSAEGEADPEAFGAWPGEEGAASEALRVEGVGEVEVAHVTYVFDFA